MNIDAIRKLKALRIKQLRIEKKLTQDELSKLCGVDRKTIGHIESGEKGWNIDSEILILEALKKLD